MAFQLENQVDFVIGDIEAVDADAASDPLSDGSHSQGDQAIPVISDAPSETLPANPKPICGGHQLIHDDPVGELIAKVCATK